MALVVAEHPGGGRRWGRRLLWAFGVVACVSSAGCLTDALWNDEHHERVQVLAYEREGMAVAGVGVVAGAEVVLDAPALVVRAHGRGAGATGGTGDACWMLELREEQAAGAIATLLTREPFGPLSACSLELEWTWSAESEEFLAARIAIRGELDGVGEQVVDDAAAEQLLASPHALDAARLDGSDLAPAVAAAERVDWRLLLPLAPDGHGTVLGAIDPGDGGGARLLVGVGDHQQRHVLVPAAVTPLLAGLRRDWSSLLPRYALDARCLARPLHHPPASLALEPPRHPATLQFSRAVEGKAPRHNLLTKVLLTPVSAVLDAAWWVLKHGPLGDLVDYLTRHAHDRAQVPRTDR